MTSSGIGLLQFADDIDDGTRDDAPEDNLWPHDDYANDGDDEDEGEECADERTPVSERGSGADKPDRNPNEKPSDEAPKEVASLLARVAVLVNVKSSSASLVSQRLRSQRMF